MTEQDSQRAEMFKNARIKKNLKQTDVAKLIDLSPATISSYELGTRKPRISVLIRYCKILGIDIRKVTA